MEPSAIRNALIDAYINGHHVAIQTQLKNGEWRMRRGRIAELNFSAGFVTIDDYLKGYRSSRIELIRSASPIRANAAETGRES